MDLGREERVLLVPIDSKTSSFRARHGYGENPLPNEVHSTIDLQDDHYVPIVVMFIAKRHSIELMGEQLPLVDDNGMPKSGIYDKFARTPFIFS